MSELFAPAEPPQREPRPIKWVNNVELEHDGRQWLPVRNHHNYPTKYNPDGSAKDPAAERARTFAGGRR